MKKLLIFLLVLASTLLSLPCATSCTKDPEDPPKEDPKPESPKLEPGIYTFKVAPMKGKWEAGDKIYVHGSYGPKAELITLTAADISADGLTASARLDATTKFPVMPDRLYAAYPGDAVAENDGLMECRIDFAKTDIPLSVAYLSGTHFEFTDASTALSFKAPGYTEFALASNDRIGMRFSGFEVEYTSEVSAFYSRKSDGYPYLVKPVTDGAVFIWLPGNITFSKGYTIYLKKDGSWSKCYVVNDNVKWKKGTVNDLGDITSSLQPYTGPEPKMPEMGKMTRYAVKFNELSGLCVDQSGDFLWCLGDGGEICQVSLGGELTHQAGLKTTTGSSLDSEGLSVNYDTGDLLIGCEPNVVCRIPSEKIDDIFKESTFKGVESLFQITDAKSFGNAGAEGCTYYKDGLVYIGTQTGSYLYVCKLETGEVLERKDLRDKFGVITEIAGLSYDPLTDWLWIVDSEAHKFFALTGDASQMLGAYPLKTKSNEESICVDHKNSCIWIGDDYGSTSYVFKYEFTGLDDAIIH